MCKFILPILSRLRSFLNLINICDERIDQRKDKYAKDTDFKFKIGCSDRQQQDELINSDCDWWMRLDTL